MGGKVLQRWRVSVGACSYEYRSPISSTAHFLVQTMLLTIEYSRICGCATSQRTCESNGIDVICKTTTTTTTTTTKLQMSWIRVLPIT